jgi:uncharacterized protein (UPF0332 family)
VFDPSKFLTVSDFVAGDPSHQGEEFVRTAVGRAYYAAHISARDFLSPRVKLQRDRAGNPTHQGVIDGLKKSRLPDLGHKLDQLMAQRKAADYQMNSTVALSDLNTARVLSKAILLDLSGCL